MILISKKGLLIRLILYSFLFLSYTLTMEKLEEDLKEIKEIIAENKSTVLIPTVTGLSLGLGGGILKQYLQETQNKEKDLKENTIFLTITSLIGSVAGMLWGVHKATEKTTKQKISKELIESFEKDMQLIKNHATLNDNQKHEQINILKKYLEMEKKKPHMKGYQL